MNSSFVSCHTNDLHCHTIQICVSHLPCNHVPRSNDYKRTSFETECLHLYHLVLQGQGHKVVNADILRKYLTQEIYICFLNTVPCTDKKLLGRLKFADRRTYRQAGGGGNKIIWPQISRSKSIKYKGIGICMQWSCLLYTITIPQGMVTESYFNVQVAPQSRSSWLLLLLCDDWTEDLLPFWKRKTKIFFQWNTCIQVHLKNWKASTVKMTQ